MSKRWTYDDDMFLSAFYEVGANYIASHDLGFTGKNAGEKRVAKLKELGVWGFLIAFHRAGRALNVAHARAFGPKVALEALEALDDVIIPEPHGARQ